MAKNRMINTRFWDDQYVSDLDPIEKLLFLYLLTNPATNICGVYEIPLKTIAMDTGIEKEMVQKVLTRFERDGKVIYRNGWVAIVNFIKHQNQKSPQVQKGIEEELKKAPSEILSLLQTEGMHTLSHLTKLNLTKPNSTKPKKLRFGELGKVMLSEQEHAKLVERFGQRITDELVFELDTYLGSKGAKYKSHYATILSWAKRKADKQVKGKSNIAFI